MINGPQKPGYPNPQNTLSYLGTSPNMSIMDRRPTATDATGYEIGWWWIVPKSVSFLTGEIWNLVSLDNNIATWKRLGGGIPSGLESLTGNTGGPVDPADGNINIIGDGNVVVTGDPLTNTLTISASSGSGFIQSINKVYLTATGAGTYTKPANLIQAYVECVGGGGGAGSSGGNIGIIGGSGAYTAKMYSSSEIGSSQPYVVGSGGSGQSGSTPSSSGGNTTFSSGGLSIIAGGGQSNGAIISLGGVASGGDINIDGQTGGSMIVSSPANIYPAGSSSMYGFGGPMVLHADNIFGSNGSGYGSTGSADNLDTLPNVLHRNGQPGIIIITEYLS